MNWFKRKPLKNYEVGKDYLFPFPEGLKLDHNLVLNEELHDRIFEENMVLYNLGYKLEYNNFITILISEGKEIKE